MKGHIINIVLRSKYDDKFFPFQKIKVAVISRGYPDDERIITGEGIVKVDRRGLYLEDDVFIPAHRIIKVILDERIYTKEKNAA